MRVIGFDAWTKGAQHYQRLVEAFKRKGLELTLIHLGSWGDEKGRPAKETIGTLPVRDISFYSRKRFRDILEFEKACAVIFLSMDSFANRAFNRYCRQRNLPTIHLFHGLQRTLEVDGNAPWKFKAHKRLWLLRNQIIKGLMHFWPTYARSLGETGATLREWFRFGHDLVGRARGYRPRVAANDSKTDRACVFIDSEIEYAVKVYGYSEDHVVAVGNPDLMLFGMPVSMVGLRLRRPLLDNTEVMYLDTALTNHGYVYDSEDEFIQHLVDTRDELSRQGKHLVFKPHPSHLQSRIPSALADAGLDVCSMEAFVSKLQRCCACIVEPSSAALIPALMGVPLFLAQYGKLDGQLFGELLRCYPRARQLADLRDFASLLVAEQADLDAARTRRWIDQNTGPLPPEDMPSRVADVVVSLILERQASAHAQVRS